MAVGGATGAGEGGDLFSFLLGYVPSGGGVVVAVVGGPTTRCRDDGGADADSETGDAGVVFLFLGGTADKGCCALW
jgi:hypothetical protein